jgi:hypothetical protein
VQRDDGTAAHQPSGTVLAAASVSGGSLGAFPTISFGTPPALTAGQLYHVVFRNTDPAPTVNFVSIDSLIVETGILSPRQARYSDTDWAQLMNYGGGWQIRPEYTPILQLNYGNGVDEGVGYMEAWVRDPKTISGSAQVRETFTVSGANRTISAVSVRVARTSGTSPLTIRLESAGGTLIDQAQLGPGSSSMAWLTGSLSASHTLQAGSTYNLVLTSPPGTSYATFAIRQGTSYGFVAGPYFGDGHMQYSTGSGWLNVEAWGSPSLEGDLQFFLR